MTSPELFPADYVFDSLSDSDVVEMIEYLIRDERVSIDHPLVREAILELVNRYDNIAIIYNEFSNGDGQEKNM